MAQQVGWQNQFDDDAIVSAALECSPCAFTDAYYAVRHSKELQSEEAALEIYEQTCQYLRPRGWWGWNCIVLCCFSHHPHHDRVHHHYHHSHPSNGCSYTNAVASMQLRE